jgi:hypothetical protein
LRWSFSLDEIRLAKFVMPGLVPGIHVFAAFKLRKTWMAGTSPAMTGGYYEHSSNTEQTRKRPLALALQPEGQPRRSAPQRLT